MNILLTADFSKTPFEAVENGVAKLLDVLYEGVDIEDVSVSFTSDAVFTRESAHFIEDIWEVVPHASSTEYAVHIRIVTENDTTAFYVQTPKKVTLQ